MGGTRQWSRQYEGRMVQAKDPMGREIYWFPVVPVREAEEGTDRWAVEHGWISVTPLRLDLTNDAELAKLAAAPTAAHPEGEEAGGGKGNAKNERGMEVATRPRHPFFLSAKSPCARPPLIAVVTHRHTE